MTTCPKCGMGYVPGVPEDEKEHRRYHDRVVNGVPARSLKTDECIWEEGQRRITVVTTYSPISQRNRAEAVSSVANLETHYSGGIYHAAERPDDGDIHLFLYHQRNRIAGLVIIEIRGTVWLCRWREDGSTPDCEELVGHDPMWSVVFIWAHSRHRNQGVARLLLREALKHLGIDLRTVGWHTPFTDSGRAFIKGLCPDEFYIAK